MSMQLKLKVYIENLHSRQKQIEDALNKISMTLESLRELIRLAIDYNIQIPRFPDFKISLDPEYLNKLESELGNYFNGVISSIVNQLMPGLNNDINDCSSISYKDVLVFSNNVKKIWQYGSELKYMHSCFKSYCDLINKIIYDKVIDEVTLSTAVSSIYNIRRSLTELNKIIPYAGEFNQCLNNIIDYELRACNPASFNDLGNIGRILEDVVNSYKYFNTIRGMINELPHLQHGELQLRENYCLKIASIFNSFINTIKGLNFEDLKLLNCSTLDELIRFKNQVEERRGQYIENIRKGVSNAMMYLSGFERILKGELSIKHSSLEEEINQFINKVSNMSMEKDDIKSMLENILSTFQEISQSLCEVIPKLKLEDKELNAIIKLIDKGGTIDLYNKELSDDDRKVFIELCMKGLLKCEVKLG